MNSWSDRVFVDTLSQEVTVRRTFIWHVGDEALYAGVNVVIFNLYTFEGSQFADVALRVNRSVRTATPLRELRPLDEGK